MSTSSKNQPTFPKKKFKTNSLEQQMQQDQNQNFYQDETPPPSPFKTDDNRISTKHYEEHLISQTPSYVSTPLVKPEDISKRFADAELNYQSEMFSQLMKNSPTKTLADLGIRKSHSYQKDKLELSLSSEVIDREYERDFMRRKIQKLTTDIEQLTQLEIATKSELIIYKKKNQKCEQNNQRLQHELNTLSDQLDQYKLILKQKEQRILELTTIIDNNTNNKNEKVCKECQRYENMMKLMSKDFQNRIQDNIHSHKTELQTLKTQFQNARTVGQKQIDKLTLALQQKDQNIIQLLNKLKQYEFDKKSTIVSENMSASKINLKHTNHQQKKISYLDRFYQFSQIIDRKLCNSSEKQRLFTGIAGLRQVQSPHYERRNHFQLQLKEISTQSKQKFVTIN